MSSIQQQQQQAAPSRRKRRPRPRPPLPPASTSITAEDEREDGREDVSVEKRGDWKKRGLKKRLAASFVRRRPRGSFGGGWRKGCEEAVSVSGDDFTGDDGGGGGLRRRCTVDVGGVGDVLGGDGGMRKWKSLGGRVDYLEGNFDGGGGSFMGGRRGSLPYGSREVGVAPEVKKGDFMGERCVSAPYGRVKGKGMVLEDEIGIMKDVMMREREVILREKGRVVEERSLKKQMEVVRRSMHALYEVDGVEEKECGDEEKGEEVVTDLSFYRDRGLRQRQQQVEQLQQRHTITTTQQQRQVQNELPPPSAPPVDAFDAFYGDNNQHHHHQPPTTNSNGLVVTNLSPYSHIRRHHFQNRQTRPHPQSAPPLLQTISRPRLVPRSPTTITGTSMEAPPVRKEEKDRASHSREQPRLKTQEGKQSSPLTRQRTMPSKLLGSALVHRARGSVLARFDFDSAVDDDDGAKNRSSETRERGYDDQHSQHAVRLAQQRRAVMENGGRVEVNGNNHCGEGHWKKTSSSLHDNHGDMYAMNYGCLATPIATRSNGSVQNAARKETGNYLDKRSVRMTHGKIAPLPASTAYVAPQAFVDHKGLVKEKTKVGIHRRALLIGVSYFATRDATLLQGTLVDLQRVYRLLTTFGGYRPEDVLVLTDVDVDAEKDKGSSIKFLSDKRVRKQWPSKANILEGMEWLVRGANSTSRLFMMYSGHGRQMKNKGGDEEDGFDECIVPADFNTAGVILDDVIHRLSVSAVPKGGRLVAVFDSCDNGTVMDLPVDFVKSKDAKRLYSLKINQVGKKCPQGPPRLGTGKGCHELGAGEVVMYAGCADHERMIEAGDSEEEKTRDLEQDEDGKCCGIMTYCWVKAAEKALAGNDVSYGEVWDWTRNAVKGWTPAMKPRMSVSHEFDIYNTRFCI